MRAIRLFVWACVVASESAFGQIPNELAELAENCSRIAWSVEIEKARRDDGVYSVPSAEQFKVVHKNDRQPWEDYWGWVEKFYGGAAFVAPSWKKTAESHLRSAGHKEVRDEMGVYFNVLGRTICSEWAKDNAIRKIDTKTVKKWHDQLTAIEKGDPTGRKRLEFLRDLAASVSKTLGP